MARPATSAVAANKGKGIGPMWMALNREIIEPRTSVAARSARAVASIVILPVIVSTFVVA
jgi:hypothetical protein